MLAPSPSTDCRGLETRLIDTFQTRGGFGVFECFLPHSLLWQRATATLKPIESFHNDQVPPPTWSWMAYEGTINYLPVPLGKVTWCPDNIISPFSPQATAASFPNRPVGDPDASYLRASISEISGTPNLPTKYTFKAVYDLPDREPSHAHSCVVLGSGLPYNGSGGKVHYVLLVHPVSGWEVKNVYKRVGVAILDDKYITSYVQPKIVWIR